ncbi:4-coumarate--CoA ligase [Forsythia ovata]|uniref:4-coumarate--CoA ligase n=1 Tax=Forsythia ovata TaxID=205694 RepID=A0ABD1WBN5_9LAMI
MGRNLLSERVRTGPIHLSEPLLIFSGWETAEKQARDQSQQSTGPQQLIVVGRILIAHISPKWGFHLEPYYQQTHTSSHDLLTQNVLVVTAVVPYRSGGGHLQDGLCPYSGSQGGGKCHNLVQKRATILSSSSSSSHSIGYCPRTKTFRSLRHSVPLPPETVPLSAASLALSLQSALSWRNTATLIDSATGHRISYYEFHRFTRNLASSLRTTVRLYQNDVTFVIVSNLISVLVLYFIVPLTGNYHFSCQST